MSDIRVLQACVASWPDRPNLRYSEWPYSREVLEHCVDVAMDLIEAFMGAGDE